MIDSTQIDTKKIKMILSSIKEGDLPTIKQNISKFNQDINLLKDQQTEQNAFFFAALINSDST